MGSRKVSDMEKSINISDLDFHGRITGKYHKGKRNPYDFPLMIFFKNPGRLLSQKINLNVLLQFNISKKITAQYILKSAEGIRSMLKWFRIERYVPKEQKVSLMASRSKDIPVFMSFIFKKINSVLNRISSPLFLNLELSNFNSNSYIKSPFQTVNQIQQIDLIKKSGDLQKEEILSEIKLINNTKITTENILNNNEDIFSADNSVSWDYKFVFHNELPVILQHVNLLLTNSKLSNNKLAYSPYYPENINNIAKSTQNKSNAYLSNYFQIINHGLHPGFETAILPHVNLLLNNISMQGDSFDHFEYFKSSKSDRNYHVILPHLNLLLEHNLPGKSISFPDVSNHSQIINHGLRNGFEPVILSNVNLLLKTISSNNIVSYTQDIYKGYLSGHGFDYSFQQAGLKGQEFAGDKKIHFTNVQHSNLVYNFPSILQQMGTIQKNMPEKILSHSNSFPASMKHDQEKNYHLALSFLIPSIIKPVLKDDIHGLTGVNLEHLIKSDKTAETSIENHELQFKTNVKIEEEMENIKRIAQEAKQTVIESVKNIQISHEEEMNRKMNINQLSDQVYRLLDRKITIEKERRGYI